MLEFEEALARVLVAVPAPTSETVSLESAAGRIAAERVLSPIDLPLFDNSAMDGYAVRAADVASAKPAAPVCLRLAGKVPAGDDFKGEVGPGHCVRLFTGSPLPAGADTVVMQEDTCVDASVPGEVWITASAGAGTNVRLRGEDVRRGAALAEAGELLSAARVGLLAAAGLAQVRVGRRPVVGLLATGSELTEPGQPLALVPGRIYESNRSALAALIERVGAVPRKYPLVTDTLAGTRLALSEAFGECDTVVTSGGVSVGEADFLKPAFEHIGGKVEFWKVAIKPGRPFVFGCYGGKLLFGLPGNPVSAFVTFLLLVRPALLRWQGATATALPAHPGVLAEPLVNRAERPHFLRVRVDSTGGVYSAGIQASHVLSSMAAAHGLVLVPPNTTLGARTLVSVLRWEI
jgi:molybdopterin molybdotransferase